MRERERDLSSNLRDEGSTATIIKYMYSQTETGRQISGPFPVVGGDGDRCLGVVGEGALKRYLSGFGGNVMVIAYQVN